MAVQLSPIEELFAVAARSLWPLAPPLQPQYTVVTEDGTKRVDFAVPELKLAIELESWAWHGARGPGKVTEDRKRERDLEKAGWRVVSFTGSEVTANAARCVRDALAVAGLKPRGEPVKAFGVLTAAEQGQYEQWIADEHDVLWQCRKLCLRALTLMAPSGFPPGYAEGSGFDGVLTHAGPTEWAYGRSHPLDVPLRQLDAARWWDAYPARYDYTNCVYIGGVIPYSACEHRRLAVHGDGYALSGCHCTYGLSCPNNCGHQWYQCGACGVRFPLIGQEQPWSACSSCTGIS